jgi:HAD superfamily hydrolase (TIGR01450 family)
VSTRSDPDKRLSRLLRGNRGFLLDLDGTLYRENEVLDGAVELLTQLRAANIPFLLCSNNSSTTPAERLSKLRLMGFDVAQEDLLTSLDVLVDYLKEHPPESGAFVVGTESVRAYLAACGVLLNDGGDLVVLTYDTDLNYQKLRQAHVLLRKGVGYVATHPDLVCPTREGDIPDCGATIALLQTSCGRSPLILGKPHRPMMEAAARRLKRSFDELVVVGDRLYTDIKMANDCGTASILVLTGEATVTDLKSSADVPSCVVSGVTEILTALRVGA